MMQKVQRQYEAVQFNTPMDFNTMLTAWGESFQSNADFDTALQVIILNGRIVRPTEWVIYDLVTRTYSTINNAEFVRAYA